jgi:HTH-type transcriptional regulator/antitoxin HigA
MFAKFRKLMYHLPIMQENESFKTPGQLISSLLESRGWTNRLLAAVLGKEETSISKVISDKSSVSAELALQLEEVFKVEAERFLSLQQSFDLAKAKYMATPNPKRAGRAQLLNDLPISEMVARGWLSITNTKDIGEIETAVSKFFKAKNDDWIDVLPHAAKKSKAHESTSPVQLAWLYRVQSIASEMLVKSYSQQKTEALIRQLKPLLVAPQEAKDVPRLFAECGIRLVFVEPLKASKIDGVCFWLDDKKPVIGLSLRFDRMDNFWFVLRHELEHVIQNHGKSSPHFDSDIGSQGDGANTIDVEEDAANHAASEFCAPKAKIDSFIARKAPIFPERDFLGFAKLLGVHPCLVAGQIRHKTGRYELFNSHNSKIREYVIPSAIVDGWGDIYPVEL